MEARSTVDTPRGQRAYIRHWTREHEIAHDLLVAVGCSDADLRLVQDFKALQFSSERRRRAWPAPRGKCVGGGLT